MSTGYSIRLSPDNVAKANISDEIDLNQSSAVSAGDP